MAATLATTLILAHAGHWLAGLMYLAPVLVVVAALAWQNLKDRRLGPSADEQDADDVS